MYVIILIFAYTNRKFVYAFVTFPTRYYHVIIY